MSQAYFLVPGLLLPPGARESVSPEAFQTADRLTQNVKSEPVRQTLACGPLTASTHLAWLWQVVTRRALPFASAPFAWLIDDGPDLTSEIWSLVFYSQTPEGRIKELALDDNVVEALCQAMRKPLEERGFILQRWDRTFYLTRRTGWGVMTPEWPVIRAGLASPFDIAPLAEADDAVARDALEDLESLTRLLQAAKLSDAARRPVTGLAITSGGCQQRFNPPTKIRSLLADPPFIRSWAQESGILNHRTGRATGADKWPADAPAGDVIAVLDALYEPWLQRDWRLWSERLPGVVDSFLTLSAASRQKNCSTSLLVACGMTDTVTVTTAPASGSGLLARLTRKPLAAETWIFE